MLKFFMTMIIVANSKAYLEKDTTDMAEEEMVLYEYVKDQSKQEIFWWSRDKKNKEIILSIAKLTLKKLGNLELDLHGKTTSQSNLQLRKYISEGVNNIIRVGIGDICFELIYNGSKVIYEKLDKFSDMDKPDIASLIISCSQTVREELLIKGLYRE